MDTIGQSGQRRRVHAMAARDQLMLRRTAIASLTEGGPIVVPDESDDYNES